MELPRNMRQLRLRAGISVKQAAQASGFSDDAWYKLERGDRGVGSVQLLHDIARALGVPAWQLLASQQAPKESPISIENSPVGSQATPAPNQAS